MSTPSQPSEGTSRMRAEAAQDTKVNIPSKDESAMFGTKGRQSFAEKGKTFEESRSSSPPSSSAAIAPPLFQVGVNLLVPAYSAIEKRNVSIVQGFLRSLYMRCSSSKACNGFATADAKFSSVGFPGVDTLADYAKIVQNQQNKLPDMHIVNIDFIVAKNDEVAAHFELAFTNCGEAEAGTSGPTFRHCRCVASSFARITADGRLDRFVLEYDRVAARRALGWPEAIPHGSQIIKLGGEPDQDTLKLSDAHKAAILSIPNLIAAPVAAATDDPIETRNLSQVSQYFHCMFDRPSNQTTAQRLDIATSLLDSDQQHVWMSGFPDTQLLQHLMNASPFVECAPDIHIDAERGFAKGNLVYYSLSVSGTVTKPATFLAGFPGAFGWKKASNNSFAFNIQLFAVMRESKIRGIFGNWCAGLGFGPHSQFGIHHPIMHDPPYVSPAEALALKADARHGGASKTQKEKDNEKLVAKYVDLLYNGPAVPSFESLSACADPVGAFVSSSVAGIHTIGGHHHFVLRLLPLIPTRQIVEIESLWSKNNIVVCVFKWQVSHDGVALPVPHSDPISASGRTVQFRIIHVFELNDNGRIVSDLEEFDGVGVFQSLGWPLDEQAHATLSSDDEFRTRWKNQLQVLKRAATHGEHETEDESKAGEIIKRYMSVCMDRNVPNVLAAVEPLLSKQSDSLQVSGFPMSTHREFAQSMEMINRMSAGRMHTQDALSIAKGNKALLLFTAESTHNALPYYGFPATNRHVMFDAAIVSTLDEYGLIQQSYGEWPATHTFKYSAEQSLPPPVELVSLHTVAGLHSKLTGFDWQVHTVEEQRNVRHAVSFLQIAFAQSGPAPSRAMRRTHLWQLLSPYVVEPDRLQLRGGGFGFQSRAKDYIACWSLEILSALPDARFNEFESILARGNTVAITANFAASHVGGRFRAVPATGIQASLSMNWELAFDTYGRINRITSLGNDERLCLAFGWPMGQPTNSVSYFSSSFAGPQSVAEVRRLPLVNLELISLRFNKGAMGRATFQPGWRWSTHLKPIVKTQSCQQAHFGFVTHGTMGVIMDDGTKQYMRAGDAFYIPPGHDGWVEGNEPCVCIDLTGFETYGCRCTETAKAGDATVSAQSSTSAQAANAAASSSTTPVHLLSNVPMTIKSFNHPDASKVLEMAKVESIKFAEGVIISRITLNAGWQYSKHMRGLRGTDLCESSHIGVLIKGQQVIEPRRNAFQESQRLELDARECPVVFECQPGHDSWCIGNEGTEVVEFKLE